MHSRITGTAAAFATIGLMAAGPARAEATWDADSVGITPTVFLLGTDDFFSGIDHSGLPIYTGTPGDAVDPIASFGTGRAGPVAIPSPGSGTLALWLGVLAARRRRREAAA